MIKIWLGIIGVLVMVIVIGGGWQKLKIQALLIDNQKLAVERDVAKASVVQLEVAKGLAQEQLLAGVERIKKIEVERNDAREKVQEMEETFANHDFALLLKNKPVTIQRLMIKKTAEVLQELADVTAHD